MIRPNLARARLFQNRITGQYKIVSAFENAEPFLRSASWQEYEPPLALETYVARINLLAGIPGIPHPLPQAPKVPKPEVPKLPRPEPVITPEPPPVPVVPEPAPRETKPEPVP